MAENAYFKLRKRTSSIAKDALLSSTDVLGKVENLTQEAQILYCKFVDCLEDDLNTANAVTVLYDVLKSEVSTSEKATLFAVYGPSSIFGFIKPNR